jgi:hypothetical protein
MKRVLGDLVAAALRHDEVDGERAGESSSRNDANSGERRNVKSEPNSTRDRAQHRPRYEQGRDVSR